MFTEDLTPYFADFGEDCVVQGAGVRGIFDSATQLVLGEVLAAEPSLRVPASVAASEGGAVQVRGTSYVIRQVQDEPPDGAIRILTLVAV